MRLGCWGSLRDEVVRTRKYVQRKDGESWAINSGEITRLACCDCGLVHDLVLVSNDEEPIGIAVRRNNRATAQRRRNINKSK